MGKSFVPFKPISGYIFSSKRKNEETNKQMKKKIKKKKKKKIFSEVEKEVARGEYKRNEENYSL